MRFNHDTYESAKREAQEHANSYNTEVSIRHVPASRLGPDVWIINSIPLAKFRAGYPTDIEIVRPMSWR